MNNQRSRSRERPNTFHHQEQYTSTYNNQRAPSADRINQQRSSSNPKQYNQNTLYPPYQQGQFKKSPSPINKTPKQSKSSLTNINPLEYQSSTLSFVGMQKLSLKDVNLKKLQKIQQLQSLLKSIKKPFQSNDIPAFQSIIQKLTPKYQFQQLYSTFVYFFIHYSLLDQNIYRMFYSIIAKGLVQMDNLTDMGNNTLVTFYDILIKSTFKITFDQFKPLFLETKSVNLESYFMISQSQRQSVVNKSLYPSSTGQLGSSIRNTLTLIRKSMQRQKASSERSPDFIHPIRQILKLIKTVIKSLLQKIFTSQENSQVSRQIQLNNTCYLIMFCQLSTIIHSKYKHHLTAEYEDTLNEITILKMKISQIKQEIQSKLQNSSLKKDNFSHLKEDPSIIKALQFSYESLKKQHDSNYLYLLFVVNLSTYNRNSLIGQKLDSTMYGFFIEPLIEEYRRSSQFLAEKIEQNRNKVEKLRYFLSIVKNYGLYQNLERSKESISNKKLGRFVDLSYSNLLLRSIDFLIQNVKKEQNMGQKLVSILNCLSCKQSSFNTINQLKSIKSKINSIKTPKQAMQIQQQKPSLKLTHLQDEFQFLINDLINSQVENLDNQQNMLTIKSNKDNKKSSTIIKKENIKQPVIISDKLKQNQKQPKINSTLQNQKYLQNLPQILKKLKQYFITKQNYQKLLIFLFLLYKNNKFHLSLQFSNQYQSLTKQAENKKNTELIIDQQNEIIESLTQNQKSLIKINQCVSKMVNTINFVYNCENSIIILLLQDLKQDKNINQISLTTECLSKLRQKCGNSQQVLKSSKSVPFIGFMLYEQQQKQCKMISSTLSEIHKDSFTIKDLKMEQNKPFVFVHQLSEQIEVLNRLIQRYILVKQSLISIKSSSHIQRIINEKKANLLQTDLNIKLNKILNQIVSIYNQCNKTPTQSQGTMIDLQVVIQRLLIKLFKLERQATSESSKDTSINKDVSENKHNQKQTHIRNKLTQQINITLLTKIPSNTHQQSMYTPREYIISHILSKIYNKFSSSLQSNPFTSSNPSLEDLLILKLKKCISLFYDKINDYMLNEFILSKKLFILRCLAITFYKMKQLADILLNKFGLLGKGYGSNLSIEMAQFIQNIFFFIPNKQILQSYLKFITTKDRFFIKLQLEKYRPISNGKVDKLIQMIDSI